MLTQRKREKEHMHELFEKQRIKIQNYLIGGAGQKKKKEEDFYEEIRQKILALGSQPEKRESTLRPWLDHCRDRHFERHQENVFKIVKLKSITMKWMYK